jgi:hypothetical protein
MYVTIVLTPTPLPLTPLILLRHVLVSSTDTKSFSTRLSFSEDFILIPSQDGNDKYTAEKLEDEECMKKVLLSESQRWSVDHDALLIEVCSDFPLFVESRVNIPYELQWLDLRARTVGAHPLNLKRHDVVSPLSAINMLNERSRTSHDPLAPASSVESFVRKFSPLSSNHSDMSIQLRALILIHFNDLSSPLLPLVFDGSYEECDLPDDKNSPRYSTSLSSLLLAHRYLILTEVISLIYLIFSIIGLH